MGGALRAHAGRRPARHDLDQHRTGNAKVYILNGPLEPYVILGLGVVNAHFSRSKDHTAMAFRAGGGFHIFFTDHIGAYAEITYLKPFTSLNDYNTVPLAFGGIFQF